jgi:hypothetical protein
VLEGIGDGVELSAAGIGIAILELKLDGYLRSMLCQKLSTMTSYSNN